MTTGNRHGQHPIQDKPTRSRHGWKVQFLPVLGAALAVLFVLHGPLAAPVPPAEPPQVSRDTVAADAEVRPDSRPSRARAAEGAGDQVPEIDAQDLRNLAQLIEAEAAGEPYAGKVAVGAVVLNRVRSPHFPDSVEAVIFQPGQFEPVQNGWFWQEPSAASWRAAREAARGADPTGGALYFWNPAKSGYQPHLEARPSAGWIGAHRFAR